MHGRPADRRGEQRLRGALAAWVDGSRRQAGWIAIGAAVFTLLCAVYAARGLGVETDTEAIFDPDLPFRRLESQLDAAFPMLEDALVVVLDAPGAGRAADAAEALEARLAAEPALYRDVFAPGTGPFFARHGLLYSDLGELEELVDRLADAQPFLAEVSRDPSLRGLFRMFERALDAAARAEARGLDLEEALADVEAAVREAARFRVRPLSFDELLIAPGADGDGRRYVLVQPRIDYSDLVPAQAALQRLRDTFAELGFGPAAEVRARFTGNLALSAEELEITRRQSTLAGVASFVLVTAILSLALRSTRLVLATMATLAAGLVWTGAFAALAIGHLNMVSMAFAVLFIGLGVDFGIHLCLRYRELRAGGTGHAEALRETAAGVGSSLVLCALTTATGFFAFVPTGYTGVGELGVIAGGGMFVSLFASLTLLPALLSLGRKPDEEGSESRPVAAPGRRATLRFPTRFPGAVAAGALVVAVLCILLVPQVRFDGNPLRVRDPGAESVQTFAELVREGDLNPWSAEVVVASLQEAAELSQQLLALPSVERTTTLLDFVPEEQEEKLQILEDARLLLNLTPPERRRAAPGAAEERAALEAFRGSLRSFAAETSSARLGEAATRVAGAIEGLLAELAGNDGRERLAALDAALVTPIADGLAELQLALAPGPVTLDSLPPRLRRRLVAPDGRARVQAFPVADLNDADAHEAFVAEVRSVAPDATGDAIYVLESGRTITRALRQAFGAATLVIALALWLLWRSVRDTALVLAPIALAALVLGGISVLGDLPFNFASVIVLPLLLGIGVDSGIHMVHRFRAGSDADLLSTSTPRAVWWSALTTIASFGSLAFASHRGMASLGQLLTLGALLTVAANLVVLPALLALLRRRADSTP